MIHEKCREPNSYMVEIPATGQCFRRNSNFIKPRQSKENSNSTDPQLTTGLPEIPQEPPVLQQAVPSSQATSTVYHSHSTLSKVEKDFYTPGSQDISQSQQRSSTYKAWTARMIFLHVHTFYSVSNSIWTDQTITGL